MLRGPQARRDFPPAGAATAAMLTAAEEALRSGSAPEGQLPELGHLQQVIYRRLSADPALAARVRGFLTPRWPR